MSGSPVATSAWEERCFAGQIEGHHSSEDIEWLQIGPQSDQFRDQPQDSFPRAQTAEMLPQVVGTSEAAIRSLTSLPAASLPPRPRSEPCSLGSRRTSRTGVRGASYLDDRSHSPPGERQLQPGVSRASSRGDFPSAPPRQILPASALDRDTTAHSTEENTEAQETMMLKSRAK